MSQRLRRRQRTRAAVVASIVGLVVAAGLVWLVVSFAASNPEEANLVGDEFAVGEADRLAGQVARGGPLLFKDPLSGGPRRELYVNHVGDDPDKGWVAFVAYAPGAPREVRCILEWRPEEERFADPCGDATFPPDGTGLTRFPATVEDGRVVIDLRQAG